MHPLPPTFRLPACCSYPSDDINKFLWMVRIGGGVFPEIKEPNYLAADGAQAWGNGGGRLCCGLLSLQLFVYVPAGVQLSATPDSVFAGS